MALYRESQKENMYKKLLFLIKKNPHYLPFLGLNYFREKIDFKFFSGLGFSIFPSLITILVTKRCNFNCLGCSSNSPSYTKNFNEKKEIGLEEIKKIIDEVAWFRPFIYLNGGEPTLRKDLIEIIKYVKEKRLVCALTTNASLLNKDLAVELVKNRLDFLSVSIDGPEEFHDRMRGVRGAYKKAVGGVKELSEYKKQNKTNYPHIRLASIIFPNQVENARHIIDLANSLEVDEIGFGLLMYYPKKIHTLQKIFVDKNKTGGLEPIGLEVDDNYKFNFFQEKYNEFLKYSGEKSKMPIYFAYRGYQLKKYFDPKIFPNKNSLCLAPWNSLLIHPNGDLGVCQGFCFGSIFKGSILKQWNNNKIRVFRKSRVKMPFPACFRCNEGQKLKF